MAGLHRFGDFEREPGGGVGIDPERPLPHQRLARQLQEDPVEARARHGFYTVRSREEWEGGAP